ncbi:MAG: IS200/IS605 family element RNA-guided endonuclease TnpB, partial [Nostoc sp.]
ADLKKVKGNKGVGFAKFKKKHGCKQSYKTNLTNGNIQTIKNRLKLPKMGWVKFHNSQNITGTIINVTVTRTSSGKYIA